MAKLSLTVVLKSALISFSDSFHVWASGKSAYMEAQQNKRTCTNWQVSKTFSLLLLSWLFSWDKDISANFEKRTDEITVPSSHIAKKAAAKTNQGSSAAET